MVLKQAREKGTGSFGTGGYWLSPPGEMWEGPSVAPDSSGRGRWGAGQLWHSWDETSPRIPPASRRGLTRNTPSKHGKRGHKAGRGRPLPHAAVAAMCRWPRCAQPKPTPPLFPAPKPSKAETPWGSSAKRHSAQTTAISMAKFKCKSRLELLKDETKERASPPGEAHAQPSARLRRVNTEAPVGCGGCPGSIPEHQPLAATPATQSQKPSQKLRQHLNGEKAKQSECEETLAGEASCRQPCATAVGSFCVHTSSRFTP